MPDGHNPQELKLEPLLDLTDPDRKALRTVAKKSQTHTSVGTILGLGLGLFLAFRFRRSRIQKLTAPRAQEWPIHVDRSTDISPVSKPSKLGAIATYTLFGLGGSLIGLGTGLFTGSKSVGRALDKDPELRKRIVASLRKLKEEALQEKADASAKKQDVSLPED
ncbi:MAG: hypothetical protein HETSPECPRED_002494 [Heterodermia speciosa]|uniref:Uncharacterized protein n=1 Tax=Heterodermia speciosa TaxID=116794 RepID=A0A8H3F711_9LECA|nr:MAG: hypothetical protein HETSPECPRED_002494 [Heterodermia speciosa]